MRTPLPALLVVAVIAPWAAAPRAARALDAAAVAGLAADDADGRVAAIRALVATADPAAARVLQALAEDRLQTAGGRVLVQDGERVLDATSGAEVSPPPADAQAVTINNRVRRELGGALAALRLLDPDPRARLEAARDLSDGADPALLPLVSRALQAEEDGRVRATLEQIQARADLASPDAAVRAAAARALGASTSPATRALLAPLLDERREPDAAVRAEARRALDRLALRLGAAELAGRIFTGLSLGSILLLAALGLAITYGVMGVINMAHGELLMVGAYAAFAMQRVFERFLPAAAGWYVVAALPVAFAAAFVVGVAMERSVIRFLYGRPLETLLATWGLSLGLIQAARLVFGAQNVQVANPPWLSGAFEPWPNLVLPWNRIGIVAFSLGVLAVVWLLMNRTRLGLFVRAVVQNRAMAGCVGVPTGRVDTLAFGLGAGIAGLGGVALSQIANVGPDMGQAYVVDSFMVVVLGGVGQLAGAVWAALGLGVASKFLEGWAGAVIAKILVLVFVIFFIQKRPQGLFAVRGRFAEGE